MEFGKRIAQLRRQMGLTQEALAQKLGVTNQAVSKWESGQCCPDIELLPRLAEVFGVSIDALFGRENPRPEEQEPQPAAGASELPWPDDGVLRVVLYVGHEYIAGEPPQGAEVQFCYEGPALNVQSALAVSCGDVGGNVSAGTDVECGDVGGSVNAGANVNCGDVEGNVSAGADADCGDVAGSINAGMEVNCGDVEGSIYTGGDVNCGDVGGSITAGGGVNNKDIQIHIGEDEDEDGPEVTVSYRGKEGKNINDLSEWISQFLK